jgi:hypothetical protein
MVGKKNKKKNLDIKSNTEIPDLIIKDMENSSILVNTLYIGFVLFGILLIISSIIYYFLKILNPFWIGIIVFVISTIISILFYFCQKKKKCKMNMIVDVSNYS